MSEKYKIWIEPGHGGRDSGAVGSGMREADISLEVALHLRDMLVPAFDVRLARESDIDLTRRAERPNEWGADLVLSLHANAGGGTGVETLIPTASPNNPLRNLADCRKLAEMISNALSRKFDLRVRRQNGVKLETETRHPFIGILRNTRTIAVLPEIAFIDSPPHNPDVNVLRNLRQETAEVLAKVIFEWFGIERGDEYMPRFNTLQEIGNLPNGIHFLPTITKLVDMGLLNGSGRDTQGNVQGLDLTQDMIRMFVVNDRAGVYDR